MKNDRSGKAAVLTDNDYSKLRRNIKSVKYKLLLDLAWYTGERWGALVQLRVSDVYHADGTPRDVITFRAVTRKKRTDGKSDTRQVPVHPILFENLRLFAPGASPWLFPNRDGDKSVTWRNVYAVFMKAVENAGLTAKGISTHSTRRSFITKLHNNGVATATIKKITGHRDFKSLEGYIEIGSNEIKGAINTL
ncbi:MULTISPECIES: tyrosine-type recombinase/integrase [unclassified Nodularia (in: cyanobacteria)]|uniref:tyrosine-type recombinase/integrase n=1 Tax=unclassified Nodularia (in: cyanobacteria) TaxID=2656917 RepID=UPI00187F5CE3|nr:MULTISPECIES: tyrosine-type recombinase/integrase [unclassified Nodularia (in: cyanobacteria)]MBE9202112.1 tyrosine-type recombinase/integrase [Nodularia sp. LEGE 06071]MCC2695804.1 tyrosine-type recombinase/integrase [Nodularia sp. LEGE 04288]